MDRGHHLLVPSGGLPVEGASPEPTQLLELLCELQLASVSDVVTGRFLLRDVSRRNLNLVAVRDGSPCYFIKLARNEDARTTLATEGRLLPALQAAGVRVPHLLFADEETGLVVVEFLTAIRGRVSVAGHRSIGGVLRATHSVDVEAFGHLPSRPPWALSLHRATPALLRKTTQGMLSTIKKVQSDLRLCDRLERLHGEWVPRSLIHSDVKIANFLFRRDERGTQHATLTDWEFGQIGDPAWDVGSAFATALSSWIAWGTPRTKAAEDKTLHRMHRFVRAIWQGYGPSQVSLIKTVELGAARLLQTAFEEEQAPQDGSVRSSALLQVARNVILEPERAAVRLLGFHPREVF